MRQCLAVVNLRELYTHPRGNYGQYPKNIKKETVYMESESTEDVEAGTVENVEAGKGRVAAGKEGGEVD